MRYMMDNADRRYQIGTWGFLGLGWWVAHISTIAAVGYLGWFLRKKVR